MTFDPSSPFAVVRNAGEAEITGVEFDVSATPVDNVFISFAGSWQNAEYKTEVPGSDPDTPFALPGQNIPNVPDLQFGILGEYTWQMLGDKEGMIRADWSYMDERNIFPNDPDNDIKLSSYSVVGARLALNAENWTVALFVKNLFDEENADLEGINSAQDPRAIITVWPRTIGLQLQYRMGGG